MRRAKSYSIVDHELLHGGYLARLSHQALSLYLFLCVVGDRDSRSYYGDISICRILRFSGQELTNARNDLIDENLICYRRPYYQVKDLPQAKARKRIMEKMPARKAINQATSVAPNAGLQPIRDIVPNGLKELLNTLEGLK